MGRHPEAVNPDRARVVGVDVARGLALLGMFAVHIFPTFTADGGPAVATLVAGGRSAATFVLVAGIGLAFVSGGRHVVRGADRLGVAAGLVVRAALIGSLGLVLGVLSEDNRIYGILPYYGLYFLLAVPLIGLSARALAVVAAAWPCWGRCCWWRPRTSTSPAGAGATATRRSARCSPTPAPCSSG
jgi:uncharacterized membrane protein